MWTKQRRKAHLIFLPDCDCSHKECAYTFANNIGDDIQRSHEQENYANTILNKQRNAMYEYPICAATRTWKSLCVACIVLLPYFHKDSKCTSGLGPTNYRLYTYNNNTFSKERSFHQQCQYNHILHCGRKYCFVSFSNTLRRLARVKGIFPYTTTLDAIPHHSLP